MKFIVADDVLSWRLRNRAFLQFGGHEVIAEAADGQQAIDLCAELKPDAVLLDVSMQPVGGDIAARAIIAAGTAKYVFMCSSAGMDAVAKPLIELGATFISKPYHRPELLQTIERVTSGDH